MSNVVCLKNKCVFHYGYGCLLSEDENMCVKNSQNVVLHCVNCIFDENELSREGKDKLKRLRSDING